MLRNRTNWVTASEVPSVLHCNQYCSRRRLWRQKLGREDRPHFEGPAVEHGRAGEIEAIESIKKRFIGSDFYQPGTVMGVDPELRLSCSPDLVQIDQLLIDFRGWEIKTPYTRPIPTEPCQVYLEHQLQALANALTFMGRKQPLRWNLYYHDRAKPEYDQRRHFVVSCTQNSAELLAQELERFLTALDNVDEIYGDVTRNTRSWAEKRKLSDFLSGVNVQQIKNESPPPAETERGSANDENDARKMLEMRS